ncbi:hypothetical protein, secreted [gut metagenome]|uniref:Porin n=1 Tax=gut metagenome TaxID=749906 RepID=J9C715_9ZZZZ
MKKIVCTCLFVSLMGLVSAQETKWLNLQGEVRVDYQREYLNGDAVKSNSGFKGKYVNIQLNGSITDAFSYSYRQRLNQAHKDKSFFDATDWAYLTYQPNARWSISAGKQVVCIGGYEYDRAPIDLYFTSEFWNHIPCYRLGVSVAYSTINGCNTFQVQVNESPFDLKDEDMYGFNLIWNGSYDWFHTLYSVNAFEYLPGKFIYYLSLGNELKFRKLTWQMDFMNRATNQHAFFFQDCSLVSEWSYFVGQHVNLFAKVMYDVNHSGKQGDYCVYSGTELTRVGGGVEFYPLAHGKRDIRLHANFCYSWGKNSNPSGVMLPKQSIIDLGLTWKVDILSFTRKSTAL